MKFDEREDAYFRTLVAYSQAKTLLQRRMTEKKLIELMRFDQDRTEIENYFEFVATPFLPRLQTLLSFDDIQRNSEVLSELLGRPVADTEKGLKKLHELKLAEPICDPFGLLQWRSQHPRLKVPEKLGDAALESFHTQSLKEAIQAQRLAKEVRRFRSLLLPLSATEFGELLEEIENLIQTALHRFRSDQLQGRRLFQLNLNVFPVTGLHQTEPLEGE